MTPPNETLLDELETEDSIPGDSFPVIFTGKRGEDVAVDLNRYSTWPDEGLTLSRQTLLNDVLINTPHIKIELAVLNAEMQKGDCDKVEVIQNAFDAGYDELMLPTGERVGHKAFGDGLLIWEGGYPSRTSQMFVDWESLAQVIKCLGEKPSIKEGTKIARDGVLYEVLDVGGDYATLCCVDMPLLCINVEPSSLYN